MESNYWSNVDTESASFFFCPGNVEEKPPTNQSMLRVYNNPLCPFAERARLSLAAKDIPFQQANVDLNNKPRFFVDAGGSVPILEKTDGSLTTESAEVIEFAAGHTTGVDIKPAAEKDAIDALATDLEAAGSIKHMAMALFSGEKEAVDTLKAYLEKIETHLGTNDSANSFLGNRPEVSVLDILIAPPLYRAYISIQNGIPTLADLNASDYPKIGAYVESIRNHDRLGPKMAPYWGWLNYIIYKTKNKDFKLPYPIDNTSFEDSQSMNQIIVADGNTGKPRTNENHIRIFGHPLCPFVERARLAFHAKGIEYQFVGIDLTEKNQWHKDINGGLVPFLELQDGTIVIESLDVAEWAQNHTENGVNLFPGDEDNKAKIKEAVESTFKLAIKIIMAAFKKDERDGEGDVHYVEAFDALEAEIAKSSTDYFIDQEHETMADLMTFPFVHRAFLIKGTSFKEKYFDKLDFTKLPKIKKWYETILAKYESSTGKQIDFTEHFQKNVDADGPKVQLYYPIPSEA